MSSNNLLNKVKEQVKERNKIALQLTKEEQEKPEKKLSHFMTSNEVKKYIEEEVEDLRKAIPILKNDTKSLSNTLRDLQSFIKQTSKDIETIKENLKEFNQVDLRMTKMDTQIKVFKANIVDKISLVESNNTSTLHEV